MFKSKSVRRTTLFIMLPPIIISMIVLTLLGYQVSRNIINNQIEDKMKAQMNGTIENIEKSLSKNKKIAETLSKTIEFSADVLQKNNYEEFVKSFVSLNEETYGVGIWFEPYKYKQDTKFFGPYAFRDNGKVIYTDDYSNEEANYVKNDWYKIAISTDKSAVWSEPYIDEVTKISMVTTTSPFYDGTGKLLGVTTADIDLTSLQNMIKNIKVGETGRAFLVDKDGTYLADIDSNKLMKVKITEDNGSGLIDISVDLLQNKKGNKIYNDVNGKNKILYSEVPETGWIVAITIPEKELYEPIKSLMLKMVVTCLIALILVITMIILYAKYITGSISKVNDLVVTISEGDLTKSLAVKSKDELGQMGHRLNSMIERLKRIISSISEGLEQVVATSEELTASADQTGEAAENIANSIEQVASGSDRQANISLEATRAAEEVYGSIEKVSDSLDLAVESSKEAFNKANQGNEVVSHAISKMRIINEKVDFSAKLINELSEDSIKIASIVDMIKSIAEKTNLLALNAAIEAARAGEQGKGFAVVAEEVRKLAEQSSSATENISGLLGGIENKIQEAVKSMNDGNESSKEGIESIENTGVAFEHILKDVDRVNGQINDIASVMINIKDNTQTMVKSIDNISDISTESASDTQTVAASAEEQAALMREVSNAAKDLSTMAFELQNEINMFKM
ncbi:methyl-accepting chemotaxis protein [Clostridium sp. MSJ-4]|uniref:Methyl-accepting chemotaxis protein n=1 Tax=Clostridium simiarum TaxID=2841506 RepID=A0ABS6EY69_9CLOT|nr:methyl-accepting chemotaxis protein [Clostridium simiarum]MBU5591171.1 methyl-accepting chemotaxis protein [Clostridium simiarum]